jgi:hypothetical protein
MNDRAMATRRLLPTLVDVGRRTLAKRTRAADRRTFSIVPTHSIWAMDASKARSRLSADQVIDWLKTVDAGGEFHILDHLGQPTCVTLWGIV